MQLFPHTMCPDAWHHAGDTDDRDGLTHEDDIGGGWTVTSYECPTCHMRTMDHVMQTALDQVPHTCPSCDVPFLDWDDATLCPACARTSTMRVRTVHLDRLEPYDADDDRVWTIFGLPRGHWTLARLMEDR